MARGAKGKFAKWLEPDALTLLRGWARSGLSDEQLAHNMGITISTLYEWKNKFSEISEALKKGKEVVDLEVENALLKSAMGHHEKVTKPIKVKTTRQDGNRRIEEEHIEYVEEDVYIPPSNTAQIFWLKNRQPEKWRDKPDKVAEDNESSVVIIDDFK